MNGLPACTWDGARTPIGSDPTGPTSPQQERREKEPAMAETAAATLDILARDVTGQKRFRLTGVPTHASIGELVRSALARTGFGSRDREGRELEYRARLEREGRQL